MQQVKIGTIFRVTQTVTDDKLAISVGSGSAQVFATPMMIALMENSAFECLSQFLDDGETSVGTAICSSHLSATPSGMEVFATAEITSVDGKKVEFKIEAFDECGKIGEGTHSRFVVNSEKFASRAKAKKNN